MNDHVLRVRVSVSVIVLYLVVINCDPLLDIVAVVM